jgi:hypothetical protein
MTVILMDRSRDGWELKGNAVWARFSGYSGCAGRRLWIRIPPDPPEFTKSPVFLTHERPGRGELERISFESRGFWNKPLQERIH